MEDMIEQKNQKLIVIAALVESSFPEYMHELHVRTIWGDLLRNTVKVGHYVDFSFVLGNYESDKIKMHDLTIHRIGEEIQEIIQKHEKTQENVDQEFKDIIQYYHK